MSSIFKEELIRKLTDSLYSSSFNTINDNKVAIISTTFVVEKDPRDGKTCRETLYDLVRKYVTHLVSSCHFYFEANEKFAKEVEKLFSDVKATVYPEKDTERAWSDLASVSYDLIEWREQYTRSKDIIRVLHKFSYPDSRVDEKKLIKLIKTVTVA